MAANPKFRFLYIIWAFFECLFFGGLLYGWGSLVFILIQEGVYSNMCSEQPKVVNVTTDVDISTLSPVTALYTTHENISYSANNSDIPLKKPNLRCAERDKQLTLVFTIASMMFCVSCAVMGHINFKFGTRVTRLCALVSFTAGALMIGFTSHEMPSLIFPGLSLLGIGGIPIFITNIQFSMLFNEGSSTVVSLLSGAFDASSGVMLIVKLLYERGIPLHWSMSGITCGHILTLINTLFFLPYGFILKPTPKQVAEDAVENEAAVELVLKKNPISEENRGDDKVALNEGKEETSQTQLPSLLTCIVSPGFYLHVMWLSVLQLRFYYFLGSLNTWLNTLFHSNDGLVSYYTNVCMYAMMCGLITSPVAGIIYDFNKHIFSHSSCKLYRDLMPAVIPLGITSFLGITLSGLVMIDTPDIVYAAFVLNTVFRSFIYSIGTSYIGVLFPSEYFGILYGLMIIISGIFSLLQYGLFSWAEASGLMSVNGFLIAFMATSLVHPLFQWYRCWKAQSHVAIDS